MTSSASPIDPPSFIRHEGEYLSFSPDMAEILGLEAAIAAEALYQYGLHQATSANVALTQQDDYLVSVPLSEFQQQLPFMTPEQIEHAVIELHSKGQLSITTELGEMVINLRLAMPFMGAEGVPTNSAIKDTAASPPKVSQGVSIGMTPDWQPSSEILALLKERGMLAESYDGILSDFKKYWQESGELRPSWDNLFYEQVVSRQRLSDTVAVSDYASAGLNKSDITTVAQAVEYAFQLFRTVYVSNFPRRLEDPQILHSTMQSWCQQLAKVKVEYILKAVDSQCKKNHFLPTLADVFKTMREQQFPSLSHAYDQIRYSEYPHEKTLWSHPVIYRAGCALGWPDIDTFSYNAQAKILESFEDIYQNMTLRCLEGEIFIVPALAKQVVEQEEPQQEILSQEELSEGLQKLKEELAEEASDSLPNTLPNNIH